MQYCIAGEHLAANNAFTDPTLDVCDQCKDRKRASTRLEAMSGLTQSLAAGLQDNKTTALKRSNHPQH